MMLINVLLALSVSVGHSGSVDPDFAFRDSGFCIGAQDMTLNARDSGFHKEIPITSCCQQYSCALTNSIRLVVDTEREEMVPVPCPEGRPGCCVLHCTSVRLDVSDTVSEIGNSSLKELPSDGKIHLVPMRLNNRGSESFVGFLFVRNGNLVSLGTNWYNDVVYEMKGKEKCLKTRP